MAQSRGKNQSNIAFPQGVGSGDAAAAREAHPGGPSEPRAAPRHVRAPPTAHRRHGAAQRPRAARPARLQHARRREFTGRVRFRC